MRSTARVVALFAVLAAVAFGTGLGWKDGCTHRPWDGPGPNDTDWQYLHYCYNDVLPLWFPGEMEVSGERYPAHDMQHDKVPYVEAFSEYPVLTGFFMYGVALATDGLVAYVQATFVLLTAAGAVATYALWKLDIPVSRKMAWVAAPPIVIHGLTNWDFLAVALAVCGWWAWRSNRPFAASLLLGLGGAAKLYPAFFLPFLFFAVWQASGWRATRPVAAGGFLGFAVPNLLAAMAGWTYWKAMWIFQAKRETDFETPWEAVLRPAARAMDPAWADKGDWLVAAGWIGAIVMLAALLWLSRRVWNLGLDPLVAGGVLTLVFLLVNKVYSPQYTLWAFPILLAFGANWLPVALFVAADTANFFARYHYISNAGWHPEMQGWSQLYVALRWLFLLWATWTIMTRHGLVTAPWARRLAIAWPWRKATAGAYDS